MINLILLPVVYSGVWNNVSFYTEKTIFFYVLFVYTDNNII